MPPAPAAGSQESMVQISPSSQSRAVVGSWQPNSGSQRGVPSQKFQPVQSAGLSQGMGV